IANATVASVAEFSNSVTVQWTSLDGSAGPTADPAGERTGVDGPLNGGSLHDYQPSASVTVPVAQPTAISRSARRPDADPASPTPAASESVAVGEVIRYRVVALLSEGATSNYNLQVTLENGLGYIADGTERIAFVSDGGITTDVASLATGGTLQING